MVGVLVKCSENFNLGTRFYVVREIDINNKTIDVISSNHSYRKACSCNETALLENGELVCKQNSYVESIAKDKSKKYFICQILSQQTICYIFFLGLLVSLNSPLDFILKKICNVNLKVKR